LATASTFSLYSVGQGWPLLLVECQPPSHGLCSLQSTAVLHHPTVSIAEIR